MRTHTFTAITLIAFIFSGCASLPKGDPEMDATLKRFAGKPDVASVYIYCDELMGRGPFTNIGVDARPLGQLGAYEYLYTELSPGRHTVRAERGNSDTVELDADPGVAYYIWQETKWGWPLAAVKLHVMNEADGQEGVKRTNLRVASNHAEDLSGAKASMIVGDVVGTALIGVMILVAPAAGAAAIFAGAH